MFMALDVDSRSGLHDFTPLENHKETNDGRNGSFEWLVRKS